jgi:2-oxo-3-hexenedioate decarboxylase
MLAATPDLKSIANDVLASLDTHGQIPTFSGRAGGFDLDHAYRVMPLLRAAFEARGEKIVGRKIGFTNREMWKVYGVDSPIWGYVTDRSLQELSRRPAVAIGDFVEPRIEPEIIFGLKAAPVADMSDDALLDCIEWLSLGYEVVQSIFSGWKFAAADAVAANGVHGALLVGKHHAIAHRKADWLRELSTFQVELRRNGELSQRGGGDLVLGSPLNALRHLVNVLAKDAHNPPLAAGEIITTGTLTLAMPVAAGETWSTKLFGLPLDEITLRFE